MAKFKEENNACIRRVKETTKLTAKVQSEAEVLNDLVQSLRGKRQELQATFDKIDQLEVHGTIETFFVMYMLKWGFG